MKKRLYIIGGIAVGIVLVWLALVYVPHQRAQIQLSAESAKARRQLADYNTTMAKLDDFVKTHENLNQLRGELESKLYTKSDILNLFDLLRQQAKEHQIEVIEISPPVEELLRLNRTVPDAVEPQFLSISLRLRGNYIDAGRLIGVIEKSDHFRSIRRCQILGSGDNLSPPTTVITFRSLLGFTGDES